MSTEDLSGKVDLLAVAERMVWFKSPQDAIADHRLFLTHVMTFGNDKDIVVAKKYFSDDDFRDALVHPLPGIFDVRSWNYWHIVLHIDPAPPLPSRF